MERVVLITGGNVGNVARTLERARGMLSVEVGREVAASPVMESEPWGFDSPDKFLNQVLVLETSLLPHEVLHICLDIEKRLGRERDEKACGYRSRTIDIDILFYGRRVIDTPELKIPHPLIAVREFVLSPLNSVMPEFIHPVSGKSVARMVEELGK